MLGDTFQGLITTTDVERVPPRDRSQRWVSEVMTKAENTLSISPDDAIEDGVSLLSDNDIEQVVVMQDDKPVGLLSRPDVVRVMKVAFLQEERFYRRF